MSREIVLDDNFSSVKYPKYWRLLLSTLLGTDGLSGSQRRLPHEVHRGAGVRWHAREPRASPPPLPLREPARPAQSERADGNAPIPPVMECTSLQLNWVGVAVQLSYHIFEIFFPFCRNFIIMHFMQWPPALSLKLSDQMWNVRNHLLAIRWRQLFLFRIGENAAFTLDALVLSFLPFEKLWHGMIHLFLPKSSEN